MSLGERITAAAKGFLMKDPLKDTETLDRAREIIRKEREWIFVKFPEGTYDIHGIKTINDLNGFRLGYIFQLSGEDKSGKFQFGQQFFSEVTVKSTQEYPTKGPKFVITIGKQPCLQAPSGEVEVDGTPYKLKLGVVETTVNQYASFGFGDNSSFVAGRRVVEYLHS